MIGFNVNQPLDDPRMIAAAIGGYETPEAAEMDFRSNAPRGMQYLTNQYQRLTGDAFADPFEDAKKQRSEAMVHAAMSGASVATGSNTGMRLLGMRDIGGIPSIPTTTPLGSTASARRPVATLQQPTNSPPVGPALLPSLAGNVDVRNEALRNMLTNKGQLYRLQEKDMQIPDVIDDNFYNVLQKRANLLNVGSEFSKIPAQLLTASASTSDDSRFDKTQAGKTVGMDIHPIAYDDNFQELTRREPEKASALYHAVTNRDYDTDVKAKSQLLTEQRGDRRKLIEGIKGLEADPVTGDLYKVVERTDPLGQVQRQRVQISPLEKAAIEAEGGTKRIYGVDLPGRGGLPKLPGMDDTELVQYRGLTQKFMKEKGVDVKTASQLAHRTLYQQQQEQTNPAPAQRSGAQQWGNALSDTLVSEVNFPIKLANELLGAPHLNLGLGNAPIPLLPHSNEIQNDVPVSDVLREMFNYAQGRPAGRTYNNQPIMPAPSRAVARRR
jgi:hypothetical protein